MLEFRCFTQGRKNTNARITNNEFKVACLCLKRNDPGGGLIRVLVDIRFHLANGGGQALRCRNSEPGGLRCFARCHQKLCARGILSRLQWVEHRSQKASVLKTV